MIIGYVEVFTKRLMWSGEYSNVIGYLPKRNN